MDDSVMSVISERSTLAETVLGFYVGLNIPVEFVLALVVLLVLAAADLLHLLIVVEVQLVVSALLLAQINREVLL